MSKAKNKRRRSGPSRAAGASSSPSREQVERVRLPDPPATEPEGPADDETGQIQIQILVGLIATGALDDYLGTIQAAISQRHHVHQRVASNQAAALLNIGDRVMLNHEIRPLYLHGATGTVTGWANQNAIVQLDHPTGRFTTGQIHCPPLGLQSLSG